MGLDQTLDLRNASFSDLNLNWRVSPVDLIGCRVHSPDGDIVEPVIHGTADNFLAEYTAGSVGIGSGLADTRECSSSVVVSRERNQVVRHLDSNVGVTSNRAAVQPVCGLRAQQLAYLVIIRNTLNRSFYLECSFNFGLECPGSGGSRSFNRRRSSNLQLVPLVLGRVVIFRRLWLGILRGALSSRVHRRP